MLRRQASEEGGWSRIPALPVAGTGAPGECVLPFGTILLAQQQHLPASSTSGAGTGDLSTGLSYSESHQPTGGKQGLLPALP